MRFTLALFILILSSLSFALPKDLEPWELDKNHTSISFDIGHLGIGKIRGLMMLNTGFIKVDPNNYNTAELEVKIDVNSLNTGVPQRDTHVKSDDFLSTEKFPHITFKSIAVREDKTTKKLVIDGDITIKGKTKRITLYADAISEEVRMPKDGAEKVVRATTATTTINRYDFGIDYGKDPKNIVSKIIDGGVGREIVITIHTEFFKLIPLATSKK